MKKLFVLFLLSILLIPLTQSVNAQFRFGVQAGINVTDLSTDLTPAGFKTATRTRFIAGGLLTYNFIPLLGIQFEPAYVQKGATVNFSVVENNLTAEVEGTISANYLELPLMLKLCIPSVVIKPYLLAGGSVALKLGDAKLKIEKAMVNGIDVISLVPADQREETFNVKSNDFILSFGGGVEIPVGLISLLAEARYDLGLTNVNNEPGDDTTYKTRGLQIKAGILLEL